MFKRRGKLVHLFVNSFYDFFLFLFLFTTTVVLRAFLVPYFLTLYMLERYLYEISI